MLTGMRIGEATFATNTVQPGTQISTELTDLIFTYLRDTLEKNVPNQPIPQLLVNPNVDEESKDILRLMTFGNLVFEPGVLRSKVISPKLFDRVLHVSFNTESFEIDLEATRETESGKMALEKSSVQERLVSDVGRTLFRTKDRNELVFEDYFAVIENAI